ncbi:MAG TPA: serine/threonine-protein kinase [Myxococcales bacterium]
MPEADLPKTLEKLVCPACRQTLDGAPDACPACGGDLRGLGGTNDTLSGFDSAVSKRTARDLDCTVGCPEIGQVVDGRYKLLEKLGEGGMGAVYKAEHVRMGKLVALKLLRPEIALDRNALKRFSQEAQIVSKLSHANTVSVFDFGELPDRTLFMAMEYVPGRDLAHVLEAEGALSERRAVTVGVQLLRSLAEAHDAGIIHRDVKPANVMLLRTREGDDFVKVVDFGIAKLAEARRAGDRHNTGRGDFVGTPLYMSPEQVSGETLDARSDLYSAGALLFELLTGKPPFDGPLPMAIAAKHLKTPAPKIREFAPHLNLSEAVEAVVDKALEKKPRDRFQTADEFRAALSATRDSIKMPQLHTGWDKASTGELAIARRADFEGVERLERRMRWGQVLTPVIALLAIAGAVAGGLMYLRSQKPVAVPRGPSTQEVEPNDGPRTATLIAPGTDVSGFIKRATRDRPDVDLFEFEVPGPDPVGAHVGVTGVPNVNLGLELFRFPDADGDEGGERLKNLARVDDRFLGGGERMTDLKLAAGKYLVRLSDRRRADEGAGSPRENTMDPYTLRVDLVPLHRMFEEEPDNRLDQAMRLSAARAVFGHAGGKGEASQVKTASGQMAAVDGLWSDDYYELVLPKGATTGCALLAGVRGAKLELSIVSTEGAKASTEHLAKQLQDKPVRVAAGEVEKKCARAAESVVFRVSVAEGESADRYVLVPLDDSEDGFAGALAACDELVKAGEAETCKAILTKGISALRVSKSVEAAKKLLSELP